MQKTPFSVRHPFWSDVIKRIITIVVSWNVVLTCAMVTFFGLLFFFGIMLISASDATTANADQPTYKTVYGGGTGDRKILSIKVSGVIVGDETEDQGGLSALLSDGYVSGYAIKKQLIQAVGDESIKGVVMEINSPGGTIYGAHAISDGISYYRSKTHQPVYAHIQGSGASGAYWAAASADKIIADYGSDVGSIGVIMGPFQYYNKVTAQDGGLLGGGVVTQNGIESINITAGTSKDIGNPYRKLTDAEIKSLQQSVNNEYDNFVQHVSATRKITPETIRNQIGAMIYDNKTALQLKLIDETASREDVYQELAKAANVEDDFQVVREETVPGFVASLFGAVTHSQRKEVKIDSCALTRNALAWQGDVTSLCPGNTKSQ